MPTTYFENSRNAKASINYQIRDGRELGRSGYGVSRLNPYNMFKRIYDEWDINLKSDRVQAQVIRISYDDLDPDKPDDVERAHEHTDETCKRFFGDGHVFFTVTQNDGEGGKLHTHVTVCNIDLTTGKALRGEKTSWRNFKDMSDEVAKEMGLEVLPSDAYKDPTRVKESKALKEMRERGVRLSVDNFRELMTEVAEKTTATNFEEYQEQLGNWGIDVRYRYDKSNKVKGISYAYIDENGEKQAMSAKKIGIPQVRPRALKRHFSANLEYLKAQEKGQASLDDLRHSADTYMRDLSRNLSSRTDKQFGRDY